MGRPPACSSDKLINVKKGSWTDEEDSKFLAHVSKHGIGNWNSVPKKAGLGKSCKPRWSNNFLRPNLNQETFTSQEEELIVRLHATIGSRWSIIAQQLPGRTDNDVKNYWNTKLKKKLRDMGIDPVTHRPFSQILADYGNIGGMPRSGMRIGIGPSLNKDLKNAMLIKPEPYTQGLSNMSSSHLVPATKMEPTQANNSGSTTKFNYYQPYDLLTQLQAMKYVTDVSNSTIINTNPPAPSPLNFYNEGALSSSSSSTCSSAASAQEKSAQLAFGWSDFLLDDAFVPTDDATRGGQGQGTLADILPNNLLNQAQTTTPENQTWEQATMQQGLAEFSSNCTSNQAQPATLGMNYAMSSNQVEATTSCDSSFVEAMVAKDNDMFLEFPELLLEEPFYF